MTDWEELYQAGETGWDKGEASPPLVAALAETPLLGRVLLPGCGRGHDVAAVARAGASEVVGLDLAPSAVALSEPVLADLPNARVVCGDLFDLPDDFHQAFDAVVEHTCFCAIPPARRDDYVRAVASALKPGGVLLGVFYLNPRDDPDPTLGPPFPVTVEELDARFGPYFTVETSVVPTVAFPGRENRELVRRLVRR